MKSIFFADFTSTKYILPLALIFIVLVATITPVLAFGVDFNTAEEVKPFQTYSARISSGQKQYWKVKIEGGYADIWIYIEQIVMIKFWI
jgi:hypothetical protein